MRSENNRRELAFKHDRLFKDLQQNLIEKCFTDLNIVSNDSTSPLKCHIILLVASSDFLRRLLSEFSSEDEVTILLPDCSERDLELFLKSIYGNYPRANFQSISHIFRLFEVNIGKNKEEEEKSGLDFKIEQSDVYSSRNFSIPHTGMDSFEELNDIHIKDLNPTTIKNINSDNDINVLDLKCVEENISDSNKRSCVTCLKTFTSLKKLQSHMKRVHPNKPSYKCAQCNQLLASMNSLEIHMRSHTGYRPFSCEECEKSFASFHFLTQHMEFHRKSKDYQCDICLKRYQNSNSLSQHKVDNHSNVKFQCGSCLKLFSAKRYLKEHEKKKHSNFGSRFGCEFCGKALSGKNELKIHSRIHTGEKPFHCEECNKYFRAKSTFTIHMKSHSGTRNAVCDECGKRFIQRADLRKHIRTHTGEKPFACLSCDRSFARKDYLLKHEKTHNKINGETNSTKGDHGAMKSRPETETLSQESVIINVSDLRSFVSESGDNMQVVRILGEGVREIVYKDGARNSIQNADFVETCLSQTYNCHVFQKSLFLLQKDCFVEK